MLDVFSAPSNAAQQAADTLPDYVLIDASKRPEAERWLYELFETPDYRNLFDGTEWASIRRVAPLLLRIEQNHPSLNPLLTELQDLECGYGLTSDKSLGAVASHLSQFIEVRNPLGHHVLLRFSDPTVARVLLAPSEDGGVPEYWSQITGVKLPDSLWGGWHALGCPESLTAIDGGKLDLGAEKPRRLNELTLSQLVEADRRATLVKLLKHLSTYFPDRLMSTPRADVMTKLHRLMNDAVRNGYTSLQALTHWCTVFGCLGCSKTWGHLAPDIYQIYKERPSETGGPEARKAASLAMELAQTQNAGRAEQWA